MTENNDREARWLAYHLGDLEEMERARVAEELLHSPQEASDVERFVQSVSGWAKRPVSETLLRIENLHLETENIGRGPAPFRERLRNLVPRNGWAWGMAAAALLVFALSQVRFSVSIGDSTFVWGGQPSDVQLDRIPGEIQALAGRIQSLEETDADIGEQVQSVALNHLALKEEVRSTGSLIVENQRRETLTRYHDFQRLLDLTGLGSTYAQAHLEPIAPDVESDGG